MSRKDTLLKYLTRKNILLAVFIYLTVSNAKMIFVGFPKLAQFLQGSVVYQIFLTLILFSIVSFLESKSNFIKEKIRATWQANDAKWEIFKTIFLKLLVAAIIGGSVYFVSNKFQKAPPARSLTIHFQDSIKVVQAWQLFFETANGYNPLESAEIYPQGKSATFPIATEAPFSKLRLDPGDQRVEAKYFIEKIEVKNKERILQEFRGEELSKVVKAIQHSMVFYDKKKDQLLLDIYNQGDPQLELKFSQYLFDPAKKTADQWVTIYSIWAFLVTFLLFLFWKKLLHRLQFKELDTRPIFYYFIRLTFILLLGVGIFFGLKHRDQILPFKLLTFHLDNEVAIPQDTWKLYLNYEGFKEIHTSIGVKIGQKIVFPIRSNRPFSSLRVDPGISEQDFLIKKITYSKDLELLHTFEKQELFDRIKPIQQIKAYNYSNIDKQISLQTAYGGDPYFLFKIGSNELTDSDNFFEIVLSILSSCLLFFCIIKWATIRNFSIHNKFFLSVLIIVNILLLVLNFYLTRDYHYALLCFNLLWMFVLPGAFIKDICGFKTDSILAFYSVSFAIGISIVLFPLFAFYAMNKAGADYGTMIFAAILTLGFFINRFFRAKKEFVPYVKEKITLQNVQELFLLNLLFFVFIAPISDLNCAPLHDPAVTSVFAQKIWDANFVKEAITSGNYPPYLQLTAAVLAKYTGLITSKVILFLTNYFVILIGISFGLFWRRFFNNQFAFFVSLVLIMFVSPKIPEMYFTGGKNAMVISIFFWFVAFYLCKQVFYEGNKPRFLQGIVLTTVVIGGFLFHYITMIIFPILVAFFFYAFIQNFKADKKQAILRYLSFSVSFLITGVLFGYFFYLQEKSILKLNDHQLTPNSTASVQETIPTRPAEGVLNKTTGKTVLPTKPKETIGHKIKKWSNKVPGYYTFLVNKMKSFYMNFSVFLSDYSTPNSLFKYYPFAFLIGWLLLIGLFWTRWTMEILTVFILCFSIFLMIYSSSFNIALYGKTMRFFIPILAAGVCLIYFLKRLKIING